VSVVPRPLARARPIVIGLNNSRVGKPTRWFAAYRHAAGSRQREGGPKLGTQWVTDGAEPCVPSQQEQGADCSYLQLLWLATWHAVASPTAMVRKRSPVRVRQRALHNLPANGRFGRVTRSRWRPRRRRQGTGTVHRRPRRPCAPRRSRRLRGISLYTVNVDGTCLTRVTHDGDVGKADWGTHPLATG
jgi:hypothetical protein